MEQQQHPCACQIQLCLYDSRFVCERSNNQPTPLPPVPQLYLRRNAGLLPGRTPTRLKHEKLLVLSPSDGRPSDKRLAAMLAACKTWQQLERLVQRQGACMNGVHITAAFGLVERLLVDAEGGSSGSGSSWVPPAAAAEAAEAAAAAAEAADARPSTSSATATGASSASITSSSQAQRPTALAARLARLALKRAENVDGQALAVAIWCLGRLRFRRDPRLLDDLMITAAVRSEQLSGQGLAMVLGGGGGGGVG